MEENREGMGSFFSQAQFCYKIVSTSLLWSSNLVFCQQRKWYWFVLTCELYQLLRNGSPLPLVPSAFSHFLHLLLTPPSMTVWLSTPFSMPLSLLLLRSLSTNYFKHTKAQM